MPTPTPIQYVIPQIPPAPDIQSLQLSINNALNNLTNQLNQQANQTVSGSGSRITDVATPTSWNDAVNKRYLDNALANLPIFPPGSGGQAANPFSVYEEGYAVVTFEKLSTAANNNVSWMVLAVDETDASWGGSSATVTASATAITISTFGTSRLPLGGAWKAGDFIVWNNSSSYEINRIQTVVSTTSLVFFNNGNGTRTPYFGSTNAVQSGKNFYRCNEHTFLTGLNQEYAQKHEFISANKCLIAAVSPYKNYQVSVNLNHAADSVPAPGLRTMNGAEYVLGCGTATVSIGQTADQRIPVSAWHSLRNVYSWVLNAPTGGTVGLQLTVLYIDPTLSTVGFIGTASIGTASFLSWSARPDGQNMPPQSTWPPPILPVVTNALAASGTITAAGTNGAKSVIMQPDGFLDFIVTAIGTTIAGGRLGVVVQN